MIVKAAFLLEKTPLGGGVISTRGTLVILYPYKAYRGPDSMFQSVLCLWHTLDFSLIVPRATRREPLTLNTFLV